MDWKLAHLDSDIATKGVEYVCYRLPSVNFHWPISWRCLHWEPILRKKELSIFPGFENWHRSSCTHNGYPPLNYTILVVTRYTKGSHPLHFDYKRNRYLMHHW